MIWGNDHDNLGVKVFSRCYLSAQRCPTMCSRLSVSNRIVRSRLTSIDVLPE
jgi:hypothetical protein